MKIRFMQIVDYWVGAPICALLSVTHRVSRAVRSAIGTNKPFATQPPRKILFIELSEMGSAILAHSSIVRAKQFPDAEVGFLIFKSNRESVPLLGLIPEERIHSIENKSFFKLLISTARTLIHLRKCGYDTVIDLELFSRFTMILSYLTGAANRVGFSNYTEEGLYRGDLLTHKVFYNGMQHISVNFMSLVVSLTHEQEEIELKQNVSSEILPLLRSEVSESERRELYKRLGLNPERRIVFLNPDPGALELRAWPISHYVELVQKLHRAVTDTDFVIVGLPSAKKFADKIQNDAPEARVYDVSGQTTDLRELLVLLSGGAALVTSDSGPAHLAALVRIPLFVFFGPESPVRYAPLHDRMKVYFSGLSCSPCYSAQNHRHSICKNNRCMQTIRVEPVVQDLIATLSANAR